MGLKYTSVPVSGYNSSPPSDDSAQTDANKVKWSTSKTKLGDPLNNAIVAIDAALVTHFTQDAILKTTNYTTTASDNLKLIEVTGVNTISLLDASTGGASYQILILNLGVGLVTVGRATAGNTINGVAGNWVLNPGTGASFRVNSTATGYDAVGTSGSDDAFAWGGVAGGTANALTVSLTPPTLGLVSGQVVRFSTGGAANTGAVTLSVNGLAASPILREGGANLTAGDLPAITVVEVVLNAGSYRLLRSSSAGLTDVIHTTGNETKAGALTLTNNVRVSAASARVELKDTTQVLPAGLWGVQSSGGAYLLLRNTDVGGNFATVTIPLQISNTDVATFVGPVVAASVILSGTATAAAATVSTELVTKGQLDTKVYGGQVNSAGTAVYLPTGWSSVRNAAGNYTITHNLGTTSYAPVVSLNGSTTLSITAITINANNFSVIAFVPASGVNTDSAFNFVVVRN